MSDSPPKGRRAKREATMSQAAVELVSEADLPTLPVQSPEFWADPERFLAPARAQHPWLAKFSDGLIVHGCQANKDLFVEDEKLWMGLDGLVAFYGAEGTGWAQFMHEMLNSQRGSEHARIRGSVAAAFTPRHANKLRATMRRLMDELLDKWAPEGAFDFAQFAADYPIAVMCALLGVSSEPIPRLRKSLEAQLVAISMNKAAMADFMTGYEIIWAFADQAVREREASGEHDPELALDAMIAAKRSGQLTERELRYLIMVLLFGGYDTSKNMLTMTMNLLLDRPAMYQRCAEDKGFCARVIDEALRHSNIATPVRQVQTSFVYDNFRFPEGAIVYMATPLSGRDPQAFDDPMRFDPERQDKTRHVAFGRGPHICIGQFLARNQLEEGLHAVAQRLKNPRRTGDVAWRPMLGSWGLTTLPVAFDPA
jgi:cytochrome P450